jgi:general secretion pathway protein D
MDFRSVSSGMRRRMALSQSCCAPIALVLLLLGCASFVRGQSPELSAQSLPPTGNAASPALPPPANPAGHDVQPGPAAETPKNPAGSVLVPPAQQAKHHELTPARPTEDLKTALERPGSLKLHGLSLEAALFMISEQWNINIVCGEVKGTVNGVFKDAPLREILDSILLSNGYNYRMVGKSLVISSVEQLGQVNPFFQSAIIPVQNADIDEVVQGAQLLKTPKGEVRALKSAHAIVVLDFPDRVKMMREFVATIDSNGVGRFGAADNRGGTMLEVGYFRTQHISAKSAELALASVLSKAGKATSMDKEDRLLVTDYPDNLAMVEKVLASIDRPRPQVRISALIYNLSLRDIEKLGINWNPSLHGRPDSAGDPQNKLGIDSVLHVPFQAGAAGSTLTMMSLNKHIDLSAVVVALQGSSDSRLLSEPNVAVLENEVAEFKSVSQIPFQQLTQTQQGGQIGTTSFKEAGVVLHVTPKIAADGLVRMLVNPEVSRLTGFTPGDNQPIIDTNSASTTLTVANRQTVVIGGMRQRGDVGDFNGIPYLKDLNLVGRLFRSRDTDARETELVVFICPEIISYCDEPTCRQKLAEDTIRCRLDQIPEAEGCPPCCRRLPPHAGEEELLPLKSDDEPTAAGPVSPSGSPTEAKPRDAVSVRQPECVEPLSAARIPSAEFQFGAAGRSEQIRALIAEGRLRRLPLVTPGDAQVATTVLPANGIFAAPPTAPATVGPAANDHLQTAERTGDLPLRR